MPDKQGIIEVFHALSEDERIAEQAVLSRLAQHATSFVGTRREAYDAMSAETPLAEGTTLEAVEENDIRGWWVRPLGARSSDHRAMLFLHGGGYMLGSARAYCGLASQIAVRAGVNSFVLDYPLAPENPFPAAYKAGLVVRRWLGDQKITHLALVGDSAGGGLALATLGTTKEEWATLTTDSHNSHLPIVDSVVVFSPWTDLAMTGPSFNNPDTHDPIFQPERVAYAAVAYLGAADPRDGRASPLYRLPDALPPLAIQVGMDELLLDDARRYAALAAEKGSEVRLDVFEGLHHVFQRRIEELEGARNAIVIAADFVSRNWMQTERLTAP